MKVLVCGGRDFRDHELLEKTLNELETKPTVIIHGGARGADSLAHLYAEAHGIPTKCHLARWDLHGRAAGPIRNKYMLDEEKPDLVIAFAGSKGTFNMIKQAIHAGIKVKRVE